MKQILSVCTGLIFGILTVGTALFLLLPESIMGMFSKDSVTIREGAAALRIISLGFVVSGISVVASGALEALGRESHPLSSPCCVIWCLLCRRLPLEAGCSVLQVSGLRSR